MIDITQVNQQIMELYSQWKAAKDPIPKEVPASPTHPLVGLSFRVISTLQDMLTNPPDEWAIAYHEQYRLSQQIAELLKTRPGAYPIQNIGGISYHLSYADDKPWSLPFVYQLEGNDFSSSIRAQTVKSHGIERSEPDLVVIGARHSPILRLHQTPCKDNQITICDRPNCFTDKYHNPIKTFTPQVTRQLAEINISDYL